MVAEGLSRQGLLEIVVDENHPGDRVDDGLLVLPVGDAAVGFRHAEAGQRCAETETAEEGLRDSHAAEGDVVVGETVERAALVARGGAEAVGETPRQETIEGEAVVVGLREGPAHKRSEHPGILVFAVSAAEGESGIERAVARLV